MYARSLSSPGRFCPRPRTVATALVAMLVASSCGAIAEKVAEEGAERAIERETGEDVDLDFNSDGGFAVKTDEGSIRVGEDGSFVVVGEDGEVITGGADGDGGFTVQGDDGSAVLDVDGDSGEITFQGDDGAGSISAGPGIPDAWPGNVPKPDGLNDVNGTTIIGDGQTAISVSGQPPGTASDYFDGYAAVLTAAGFTSDTFFESGGNKQALYEGAGWSVSLSAIDGSSNPTIAVSLAPSGS